MVDRAGFIPAHSAEAVNDIETLRHRRISLRFRPTRFLSTVAAVVSGPHPRAVAPRRHTKNALRLRHTGKGAVRQRAAVCRIPCRILCLADVTRVGECRAPNARCGVTERMDSATISLNSFDIC